MVGQIIFAYFDDCILQFDNYTIFSREEVNGKGFLNFKYKVFNYDKNNKNVTFVLESSNPVSGLVFGPSNYILTSTVDILTPSGDSVLFQAPPAPLIPKSLAVVLEENNPMQTFQTMMSGIIKYLLLFVIGLVAFWKSWQFLSKALQKA